MKIYHNGKTYAVLHPGSKLLLMGPSLSGTETERKIFYSDYAITCYLKEHGYHPVKEEN